MDEFTLFLIIFPIIMGLLFWLKRSSDRNYGTAAERAAEIYGYSAAPQPERTKRPKSHETANAYAFTAPARITQPTVQPGPPAGPPPVLFDAVWHHLMKAVHLLIVGETHSGKSTSARAVLAGRIQAGDEIVIFDPHATPATWAGLRAVGAGRDFAAIEQGMTAVLAEMTARYKRLAENADYQPRPLTIFVDEWPAIQTACKKTAAQFITELAQEGRKAGMRLVMLTQSDLVASLGIEGKGDVRENFLFLLLGQKAITRCDAAAELERPAALRRGEGQARAAIVTPLQTYSATLDTSLAVMWVDVKRPQNSPKPSLESSPKMGAAAPNPDPELDPLWAKFLNGESLLDDGPVTSNNAVVVVEKAEKSTDLPVTENAVLDDTKAVHTNTATLPTDELSVIIQLLVKHGMSRNKILQYLTIPGTRNAQLARIKQALGESETAAQ